MNNDELIRTLTEAGHHEEAASLAEKARKAGDKPQPQTPTGNGPHDNMNAAIRSAAGYSAQEKN